MQVGKVIEQVRNIIQDTGDSPRYPDAMLVGYVNMAVQSIAVARPDLFACIDWVDLNSGAVVVNAPPDSIRIIEVNNTRVANVSATYADCVDGDDDEFFEKSY